MKALTVREIMNGEQAGTIKSWKAKELIKKEIRTGWHEFSGYGAGYKDIMCCSKLGISIKDYILKNQLKKNPNVRTAWLSSFIGSYFVTYIPNKEIIRIEV